LNNIAKHAHARHVGITVHRHHDMITASVEDDGVGFHVPDAGPGALRPPGWGLAGMIERVEALGGQLIIESAEGAGTTLLLRLPLA
jgi:signal transduction histidine kinase